MRPKTRTAAGALALTLAALAAAAPPAESGDITLRPVKYSDLGRMIRDFKGKVVIVDFWAEY